MIKTRALCLLLPTLLVVSCGGSHQPPNAAATTLDSSARTFCQDVNSAYVPDIQTATAATIQGQKTRLARAVTAGRQSSDLTIHGLAQVLAKTGQSLAVLNQEAKNDIAACRARGFR